MSANYGKYSKCFERSIKHIFMNFLGEANIVPVVETENNDKVHCVWIEIEGSVEGVVVFKFLETTLKNIAEKLYPGALGKGKLSKQNARDISGEIGNMITGTFANQLQYLNQEVLLNAPEFDEDPIPLKTLYENISFSYDTLFGEFDAEIYFREE